MPSKRIYTKKEIRRNRILLLLVLLLIAFFSIFSIIKNSNKSSQVSADDFSIQQNSDENDKKETNIKITVVGDIMCHNTQYQDAYNNETKTYDFSYVFENIKDKFKNTDLVIGNLETTFAGVEKGYSSYPTFNSPEILGKNLKNLGIDILSTANNHSLDKGYSGIVSTLDFLDQFELDHMGTYRSIEEQDTILYKDINGIKIAFLSYTYGTNGISIPKGKEYCINLIDTELILKHISKAKQKNVDLICVNMHWGDEYKLSPNKEQKDLADFLFENGVDIILGSHPHVLEPMEKRTITTVDGETKEVFVIYSLGNFISGQVKENTKTSIILDIEVTKDNSGKISIDHVTYTPIYMYKSTSSSRKYKLLDINKSIIEYENGSNKLIGQATYDTLKTELNKVNQIVGPEI